MNVQDGKILRIDVSNSKVSWWEDFKRYKRFVGGRAVNQYILFNELPLDISPFDPTNMLAFGAGLLCGTDAPGACRLNIDSKNTLTEGIGSSNVGGYFAPEMRFAGINNIIIRGRCPNLSYILIDNGDANIIDAKDLKGKTTTETEKILKEKHGDVKVLCIGPAGENLVRSSCIIVDGARAAGRCGLGAIMGSKNLKAIAVKGNGEIEVHNPNAFQKIVEESVEKLNNNKFNKRRMKYGVYCYDEPWDIESPYRNFSGEIPPPGNKERLMPDIFLEYKIDEKTCPSCPIRCWSVYEFEEEGSLTHVEALQGNDPHNFGAKLDLADAKTVLKAHALCNDLGLDVDNVSGVISWAMECYERGLLTKEDTDGLALEWGDSEVIFELLRKIAFREGFGDLLAEGCKRASEKIGGGTEKYCIHVKGQELFECLWLSPSWALGTMVAPRGGTHTRGAVIEKRLIDLDSEVCERYFGVSSIGDESQYKNKERLVYFFERLEAFLDCVGICMFTNSLRVDMLMPEDYALLFSAATGKSIDWREVLRIGERTHNIEKAFNVLHTDWGRREDIPPRRFVNVPLDGKYRIDLDRWDKMLDRYYALHGWDTRGIPTKKTLDKLGLENIAKRLGKRISKE
ncbi:MAG: aldehyde ferredoxin oxidoreductase family protein [Methanomicrobia archaeon]|nr:aldehyde ferredoxin oxidoreductase family protein [Methanomicrobia archaeon]